MAPVATGDAPFLAKITDFRLSTMAVVLNGLITIIRTWQLDGSLTGTGMVKYIAAFLLPAVLFSSDLRSLPPVHSELRNLFDMRGANLIQHQISKNAHESGHDSV